MTWSTLTWPNWHHQITPKSTFLRKWTRTHQCAHTYATSASPASHELVQNLAATEACVRGLPHLQQMDWARNTLDRHPCSDIFAPLCDAHRTVALASHPQPWPAAFTLCHCLYAHPAHFRHCIAFACCSHEHALVSHACAGKKRHWSASMKAVPSPQVQGGDTAEFSLHHAANGTYVDPPRSQWHVR